MSLCESEACKMLSVEVAFLKQSLKEQKEQEDAILDIDISRR